MTRFAVKKNLLKAFSLVAFTAVATGTLSTGQAQAVVLTFDDLPAIPDDYVSAPIPNGYGGLNWDNFYYLPTPSYTPNPSGYIYGTVSSPNVAYNAFANPATVSNVTINGDQFDFNSAYLTAAWSNGLNILVEGFLDGTLKYSTTVTVDTTSPTLFNFDFLGIDSLRFTSYGGVDAGYAGPGKHFALDNFTYEYRTVPEPATMLGLLTVAGFGVTLRRQQKQQQKATSKA